MSAILSFLGGSAFRAIWGEVAEWMRRKQEHAQEIEALRLQAEIAVAQHQRNLEAMRVQADLGIKTIEAKSDADQALVDAEAFRMAMASANQPTGVRWVDAWNGVIRPLAASIAVGLWVAALHAQGYRMTEWDREVVGVVLGFFFAHRVFVARK